MVENMFARALRARTGESETHINSYFVYASSNFVLKAGFSTNDSIMRYSTYKVEVEAVRSEGMAESSIYVR